MKKLLSFVLCFVVLFAVVGCGNKKGDSNQLPDFKDCEIGYQLEVYPEVAFDYELSDGTIVHIDSITATLTAKNEIKAGDKVSEPFYRYEVTYIAIGSVSPEFLTTGQSLWIDVVVGDRTSISLKCIFDTNGSFEASFAYLLNTNNIVYFLKAST